jgi:hypothetical protein
MPVRLREFYWNQLIQTKEEEREAIENASKKPAARNTGRTSKR